MNEVTKEASSAMNVENGRPAYGTSVRSSVTIEQFAFGEAIDRFVNVARYVYRNNPNYVEPLAFDAKAKIDPKKNPFFEHAEGVSFIAVKNGVDVGRITAHLDLEHLKRYNDSVGFFGYFDTIDDQEVADALLREVARWLRSRGMKTMRGPLSLGINEDVGVLVEGFDTPPMFLMPHHWPYQSTLLEGAGFQKEKDFYAWRYDVGGVPKRARKAHDEIVAMPEVRIRTVDFQHFERDVGIIMDIFNDAWAENWGYVPLTPKEMKKLATDLRLIIEPELGLIAEVDGEPAAVSVAVPNVNEAIRDLDGKLFPFGLPKLLYRLKWKRPESGRLLILGIKKKYRMQRKFGALSAALYVQMNDRAAKLGLKWGELSWTVEDNAKINVAIKLMGGTVYKRYRLYCRVL